MSDDTQLILKLMTRVESLEDENAMLRSIISQVNDARLKATSALAAYENSIGRLN